MHYKYIFICLQPLIIISNIGLMTTTGADSEPCQASKMALLEKNYFHKMLNLRNLTGIWIHLCTTFIVAKIYNATQASKNQNHLHRVNKASFQLNRDTEKNWNSIMSTSPFHRVMGFSVLVNFEISYFICFLKVVILIILVKVVILVLVNIDHQNQSEHKRNF